MILKIIKKKSKLIDLNNRLNKYRLNFRKMLLLKIKIINNNKKNRTIKWLENKNYSENYIIKIIIKK
jgi:hypothetical protein